MQCPQCQQENLTNAKFCQECGQKLSLRCPSRDFDVPPAAKFCPECGQRLSNPPLPSDTKAKPDFSQSYREVESQEDRTPYGRSLSARNGEPEAERRQLTVMFCDLVGSTALSEQLDPEELREVVGAYQQTCAEVICRLEGRIVQRLEDGLLIYFGYPQAHEDDAHRALWTGLSILEAMKRLNTRLEKEKGVRLALRVGIHRGEAA